ncbi:hypothetical protein HYR69_01740 [Candidatus Sumerlaeota bacterium]|nr:hypothetical protein [Candidatus Sumerlaeota bacterium]
MNILKAHSFVQSKYISYAASYRTADLLKAYERLLDVARALRPAPGTEYVADAALLLEEILMELFASPRPNR